jgi:hypothetical protein
MAGAFRHAIVIFNAGSFLFEEQRSGLGDAALHLFRDGG